MKRNPFEIALKTIRNYEMVRPGDVVLAAVSGGPDSIFLLHLLVGLKRKLGIRDVVVCNLDHGLRGEESARDSRLVKEYASRLGLAFVHRKVSLKGRKVKPLSTEELARQVRYDFFNYAAAKSSANVIATGHTLDDQAETVLMRLVKGASLQGIVGISPGREEGDLKIIRPLIEIEKDEIVTYLDGSGIRYRIDSTNREPIYFRNIVRSEIMPFLERYNPRLKRVLFNLAEHLREDFEFIRDEKKRVLDIVRRKRGGVEIKLTDIIVQPKAMQKELLRDSLEKAGGEVKKLSFRHWKEVEALIKYGRRGNSIDLPGNIRASRSDNLISFYRRGGNNLAR
ncbi:MAG: tRNA lysidine(34) synthetase TilS [Candidatus Omnitrophica bacterium]|nr:tRNA lysidine(34) synthetase TilS [Candidatus Omnitrophota bacterium]